MNQPRIQIPLDLPNGRVEKYEQTDKGLVITVVSTRDTAVCRQCGRTIDKFHGYDKAITLRHLLNHIANYFIRRETSGFVEGLNNKIKVIKRHRCGIYNLGRLFGWMSRGDKSCLRNTRYCGCHGKS